MKAAPRAKEELETPEQIEAAIAREREAGAKAGEDLARLNDERNQALLAGDDRKLDRIEAEITKAQRATDRADLRIAELEQQLDAAQRQQRDRDTKAHAEQIYPLACARVASARRIDELLGALSEEVAKWERLASSVQQVKFGPFRDVFWDQLNLLRGGDISFCIPPSLAALIQPRFYSPSVYGSLAYRDHAAWVAGFLERYLDPAPSSEESTNDPSLAA
jgi:hypothetical protein